MRFHKLSAALALLCLSCASGPRKADKDLTPAPVDPATPIKASELPNDPVPGSAISTPATPSATAPTGAPGAPTPNAKRVAELEDQVQKLNLKIETLESRLSTLGEKVDTTRGSVQNLVLNQRARGTPTTSHPADLGGVPVKTPAPSTDPESGFVNDEAVQAFRKAMVLHRAGKYSESLMLFSGFLERFPDHPLAGNAQFFLGNAYFMQKEYRLALQEYQRVLTSYDRSGLVARTLAEMAESEDFLRRTDDAAHHRQLLNSLFPHSPFTAKAPVKPAMAHAGEGSDAAEKPAASLPADVKPSAKSAEEAAPSKGAIPPTAPIKSVDPVPGESEEDAH